jgi:hypothetical protein
MKERVMKKLGLLFFLLASCGRSECDDYATVYCLKASSCGYNQGGVIVYPGRTACEKDAHDSFSANHLTEAVCASAREKVAPMTCDQFQKFAAGGR